MGRNKKRKRGQRYPTWTNTNLDEPDEHMKQKLDDMFSKEFTYPEADPVDLGILGSMFTEPRWSIPELQAMKVRLNDIKSRLSSYDITQWHHHTTSTHPGGQVVHHIRQALRAELCTQAWCKLHEIIQRLNLTMCLRGTDLSHDVTDSVKSIIHGVQDTTVHSVQGTKIHSIQGPKICSVHLCEAPGGFITSLNHYLRNHRFCGDWSWLANTLNPYHEGNGLSAMIDDDQFIYETLDHWNFGRDDTGDIMSSDNIKGLTEACQDMGNVHLVTADGSIDCADSPGEQEVITSKLHFSELVAALHVLHLGGHFVLKMFTLFEDSSVGLIYLLRATFHKLCVFKPVTSKPGNSEVYIIAQGYRGLPSESLRLLLRHVESPLDCDNSIFPLRVIPAQFLESHRTCCEQFTEYQAETITHNLELFEDKASLPDKLRECELMRKYCVNEYVRRYEVSPIDQQEWVIPPCYKSKKFRPSKMYRHKGSYVARQHHIHLQWNERVTQMEIFPVHKNSQQLPWLEASPCINKDDLDGWRPIRGRGFTSVQSSRFCDNKLLLTYNDVIKHAKCLEEKRSSEDYTDFLKMCVESLLSVMENPHPEVSGTDTDILLCDLLRERIKRSSCEQETKHEEDESSIASPKLVASDSSAHKIVAMDCYGLDLSEQTWCGSPLVLHQLIRSLQKQVLKAGNDLIMSIPPLLTRLNAAVVFTCRQCFNKVTLMIPDEARFPICFLVATGYKPIAAHFLSYLSSVLSNHHGVDRDQTVSPDGEPEPEAELEDHLLGIVPMQCLYDENYHGLLWQSNTTLIQRRINYIILREKQLLQVT